MTEYKALPPNSLSDLGVRSLIRVNTSAAHTVLRFEGIKCTLKKKLYIDYLERHKHCSVTDGQNNTV